MIITSQDLKPWLMEVKLPFKKILTHKVVNLINE